MIYLCFWWKGMCFEWVLWSGSEHLSQVTPSHSLAMPTCIHSLTWNHNQKYPLQAGTSIFMFPTDGKLRVSGRRAFSHTAAGPPAIENEVSTFSHKLMGQEAAVPVPPFIHSFMDAEWEGSLPLKTKTPSLTSEAVCRICSLRRWKGSHPSKVPDYQWTLFFFSSEQSPQIHNRQF